MNTTTPDLDAHYLRVFDTGQALTAANRDPAVPPYALLEAASAHIKALEQALDATIAHAGLPPRDTDLASMELQGRLITAARNRA